MPRPTDLLPDKLIQRLFLDHVFTLQCLLGQSSREMVQHYARLAQIDIEQAHRRASPADNWRL